MSPMSRPGVGLPTSACTGSVRRFNSSSIWIHDLMITTGLVDTVTTAKLLKLIERSRAAAETHTLEVVLTATRPSVRSTPQQGSTLASSSLSPP